MDDDTRKHLDRIQSAVTRMASHAFTLKGRSRARDARLRPSGPAARHASRRDDAPFDHHGSGSGAPHARRATVIGASISAGGVARESSGSSSARSSPEASAVDAPARHRRATRRSLTG